MTAARRKILRVSLVGLWLLAAACAEAGPRLYVSNEFVDTVTVIDLQTEERVATIQVGKRPRGIKASPDGQHVYFALGEDDAIGVIEVATNKVLDKIPAGEDPEAFDISPDGRFLYVSNEEVNTASLIDIAERKVVKSVRVGVEPEGVAVSPDGKWVYVSSETSHTISVIDAASFKVVATVLVGDRPRAIAFSPDGTRAYVTAEVGGTVSILDAKAHKVLETISVLRGEEKEKPMGVAVTPDGSKLYVSTGRGNTVAVIDAKTHKVLRQASGNEARGRPGHDSQPGRDLLIRGYETCTGCGICTMSCPVWWETRDVWFTPHGRARALQGGASVDEVADSVLSCQMCGACEAVYRSTDGGKTWRHMGLRETQAISRVRVHPTDPDLVYVAALGHPYGENESSSTTPSSLGMPP